MGRLQAMILAGSSLLMVAACASTPMGPMIPVMPGPQKSPEAFAADDDACQQYAEARVQGHVQEAQNREVAGTALGTAVGAGLGAAAGNTKGAIIGGVAGALVGSQASGVGYNQGGIQRQYDMAYAGCMTSRGNEVAGGPPHRPRWYRHHGYGPPPAPPPGSSGPGYDQPPPPPDDEGQGPPPPPRG